MSDTRRARRGSPRNLRARLCDVPDLPAELVRLLAQIPAGRVTTYGALGRALGDVRAARWVGEYLLDHPHEEGCGCHRVIRTTGEVGLYITGDAQEKRERLRQEGVPVAGDRVDTRGRLREEFDARFPLQRLCALQSELPEHVRLTPLPGVPETVAGIDVSYPSPREAVAAYVLLTYPDLQPVWSTTITARVRFPYIPAYLSFRELPLQLALFERVQEAGRIADVTLVDGNARLHPRRAGSATCYGLASDTAVIGVGKKLLCGRVDLTDMSPGEARPVIDDGERIGAAIKAGPRSRPVFVSPGHRIDMDGVLEVAQGTMRERRLPVPIHLADRLSRTGTTT